MVDKPQAPLLALDNQFHEKSESNRRQQDIERVKLLHVS
jgi:hypothetical protein